MRVITDHTITRNTTVTQVNIDQLFELMVELCSPELLDQIMASVSQGDGFTAIVSNAASSDEQHLFIEMPNSSGYICAHNGTQLTIEGEDDMFSISIRVSSNRERTVDRIMRSFKWFCGRHNLGNFILGNGELVSATSEGVAA